MVKISEIPGNTALKNNATKTHLTVKTEDFDNMS